MSSDESKIAVPEPFEWDESFDVKVELFNDQHKKLFKLINMKMVKAAWSDHSCL